MMGPEPMTPLLTGPEPITVLLTVLAALLGLAVGSFLNVVVWRVPLGLSVVAPPSACPVCAHPIRRRDNVPVVSWLLLRARCRDCAAPISARYPLVEAVTGLVFAGLMLGALLGADGGAMPVLSTLPALPTLPGLPALPVLPALLYLAAISIALALIDIDTHTLPNSIVLPAYLVSAALLAAASLASGDWGDLLRAGIGGAALFAFYLVLVLIYPRGMGLGDVKLAGVLGAHLGYLGWDALAVGAFAAFVLGGLFAIALIITRRVTRSGGIPFGPWMLAGAWVGIIAGAPVAHTYLTLVGLEWSTA
jgi:leader peptidase (prepilin peptidase)/N-methyltransferase